MSLPLQKHFGSVAIEEILIKYASHVEFLGGDLNDVEQVGAFGSQIIHLASFANQCTDIVALLQAGANTNAVGDLGLRPLHYAVLGGAIEAAYILLQSGANVLNENEFGETPAQMAGILNELALEEMLSFCIVGQIGACHDGGSIARRRWLDFRAIQQENFYPYP